MPAGTPWRDCLSPSLSVCWHSRGKLSFVCLACAGESHKQTIGVAGRHDGADRVSDKWQVKSLTVCFYHRLVSVGFPLVTVHRELCVCARACVPKSIPSYEQSLGYSQKREKTFPILPPSPAKKTILQRMEFLAHWDLNPGVFIWFWRAFVLRWLYLFN